MFDVSQFRFLAKENNPEHSISTTDKAPVVENENVAWDIKSAGGGEFNSGSALWIGVVDWSFIERKLILTYSTIAIAANIISSALSSVRGSSLELSLLFLIFIRVLVIVQRRLIVMSAGLGFACHILHVLEERRIMT